MASQTQTEVAKIALSSLAPNTQRNYGKALGEIERWLDGASLDDETLSTFLTARHAQGNSPATLRQFVAGVRWLSKATSTPSPVGVRTTALLRRYAREGRDRGRGQSTGIDWLNADMMADRAEEDADHVAGVRDAAVIAVMSDALLRSSEVVALQIRDVEKTPDGGVIHLRFSKTDQAGKGETRYISTATYGRVQNWIEVAKVEVLPDTPLFRSLKGRGVSTLRDAPMSTAAIRTIIKKRAKAATRIPLDKISGHSLRVGSAQSLARAGASLVEMQTAGGWQSPSMPARYARNEMAGKGAVARLRYKV